MLIKEGTLEEDIVQDRHVIPNGGIIEPAVPSDHRQQELMWRLQIPPFTQRLGAVPTRGAAFFCREPADPPPSRTRDRLALGLLRRADKAATMRRSSVAQ
jgi:hypothetical protein